MSLTRLLLAACTLLLLTSQSVLSDLINVNTGAGSSQYDVCTSSSPTQYWRITDYTSGSTLNVPSLYKGYTLVSGALDGTSDSTAGDADQYVNTCLSKAAAAGHNTVNLFWFNDSNGSSYVRCAYYDDDSDNTIVSGGFYYNPKNNWGQRTVAGGVKNSVSSSYLISQSAYALDSYSNPC